MHKKSSRIAAFLMAAIMVFSLSGCSSDNVYLSFLLDGWDGIVKGEVVWENGSGKDADEDEATENEVAEGEDNDAEEVSEEEVSGESEEETEAVTDTNGETVTTADGKTVTQKAPSSNSQSSNSASKKPSGSQGSSSSSSSGNSNTAKPQGGTSSTTAAQKTSYTAEEALNLYKTAANQIKTMADGKVTVTRTREVYTEVGEKNLSGLSGTIISAAFGPKDDTSQKTYSSKSDIQKSFVVEKQSYVCNLTMSDVKSVSAKVSGNNVIVTIYVKDDTSGQNYSNKAVSATAVAELAATFKSGLNMSCKDVRVTGTIDSQGRLINLNTYMPGYFTQDDQKFGAAIEQWWTISYK